MRELEERIRREGRILEGDILRVDGFLNHRIDTGFAGTIGEAFHCLYADVPVNMILTAEASGIVYALTTAQQFGNIPVVFAKKAHTRNMDEDCYTANAFSYTHGVEVTLFVEREYLSKEDHVLIIDDFLANGETMCALADIVRQSGAVIAGCGAVIEKAFQRGRRRLEEQGIRVSSLARIREMSPQGIQFEK